MPDTGDTTDRSYTGPLERVDDCTWRIPRSYKPGMLADGLIFTDERLIPQVRSDRAAEQVANVACLPGIQGASLAMPDGVARTSLSERKTRRHEMVPFPPFARPLAPGQGGHRLVGVRSDPGS